MSELITEAAQVSKIYPTTRNLNLLGVRVLGFRVYRKGLRFWVYFGSPTVGNPIASILRSDV